MSFIFVYVDSTEAVIIFAENSTTHINFTESDCLDNMSPLDTTKNLCQWEWSRDLYLTTEDDVSGHCLFLEPEVNEFTILGIVLVILYPFEVLLDYCFEEILIESICLLDIHSINISSFQKHKISVD